MRTSILGFASVWMIAGAATPAMAQSADWRVSQVSGHVRITDHGRARAATRGALLASGATITTDADGRAVLVRGRDYVVVSPRSQMRVPEPAQQRGIIQMLSDWGTALFRIEHRDTPHFGVQTPYLAAVVKGTVFTVTVGPSGASVQVTQGAVEVSTVDGGAAELVRAGMIGSVSSSDLYQLNVAGETNHAVRSGGSPAPGVVTVPAPAQGAYSGPATETASLAEPIAEDPVRIEDSTRGLVQDVAPLQLADVRDQVRAEHNGGQGGNPGQGGADNGPGDGGQSGGNGNTGGNDGGNDDDHGNAGGDDHGNADGNGDGNDGNGGGADHGPGGGTGGGNDNSGAGNGGGDDHGSGSGNGGGNDNSGAGSGGGDDHGSGSGNGGGDDHGSGGGNGGAEDHGSGGGSGGGNDNSGAGNGGGDDHGSGGGSGGDDNSGPGSGGGGDDHGSGGGSGGGDDNSGSGSGGGDDHGGGSGDDNSGPGDGDDPGSGADLGDGRGSGQDLCVLTLACLDGDPSRGGGHGGGHGGGNGPN